MSIMRFLVFSVALLLAGCAALVSPTEPLPKPALPEVPEPVPTAPVAPPPIETPVPPKPVPPPVVVAPVEPVQPAPRAMPWLSLATWTDLPGWLNDDHAQAWPALQQSCRGLRANAAWQEVCQAVARFATPPDSVGARDFFERHFQPWRVSQADGGGDGLVTGYYEPLLRGSRTATAQHRYPLYAPPGDLLVVDLATVHPELKGLRLRGRLQGNRIVPYFTRAEIEAGIAPVRGREIAWVDDPVELFFLQVQGSGRLQLDNGEIMRIGYAEHNGHPYVSIGRWLIDRGELTLDKASMQGIKDWGRRNPARLQELLHANPSFVFFRELPNHLPGPIGSLGVPLTVERSMAVDPRGVPLGAPVWLATTRPNSNVPLQRLMLAQDTGSAIRGNVRADFFWGFGDDAGKLAGAMKQRGRMWVLLPRNYPLRLVGVNR